MPAFLLSCVTFFSTLGGGLFALRFQARLRLILSFSAGVLLGVVSFDLLPKIFELSETTGHTAAGAMIALVGGFLLFHGLEKFVLVHHGHEGHYTAHHHPEVGVLSALALAGHSFLDGVGIGLAFQVSRVVGIGVAVAVIAHDFCDGINTVSVMRMHRNTNFRSVLMLVVDALAPIAGVLSTGLFHLAPWVLMIYLGFFAGFLLYLCVSDILPEAHSRAKPAQAAGLMGLTCMGAAFIFVVIHFAG